MYLGWVLRSFSLLVLALASMSSHAAAQQIAAHVDAPPAPERVAPELNVALRLGAVQPLESADICPGESLCVLGAGGSFGIEIERRWPIGVGIAVAYDAWFVDSGGVFELGIGQIIRAAVDYAFLLESMVHPTVHIGGGALVFGDTFLVETVGGALEAGAGVEIELTESVVLDGGAALWLFSTTPFTTGRDRTMRSRGAGLNLGLQVSVGLTILADRGGL